MGGRSRLTGKVILLLAGSLLLAFYFSHLVLPKRNGIVAMNWPQHWVEPASPTSRAYFRQTIEVPFTPKWAWVSVATEDYILYVNGQPVGDNVFTIDPSRTLQHRTSDVPQGLTPFPPAVIYKPEIRREANQEWRFPELYQIASFLRPGRNELAIYQQSPDGSRFAIQGEIIGDGQRLTISSDARDWKTSLLSTRINGKDWFSPYVQPTNWDRAHDGGPIGQTFYASSPPEIWRLPMPVQALTGPNSGGSLKLGLSVPRLEPGDTDPSWVRVYSNWPYYLFMNGHLVGKGNGLGTADAWDLSNLQSSLPQRLSIRLARPRLLETVANTVPVVAIDGRIGGWPFDSTSGWQQTDDLTSSWVSGAGAWRKAQMTRQDIPPSRVSLQMQDELGLAWYARFVILWLACAAILSVAFIGLSAFEHNIGRERGYAIDGAIWILSLTGAWIAAIELLRLRFLDSDSMLMFAEPDGRWVLGIGCPTLLIIAFLVYHSINPAARSQSGSQFRRHAPILILCAIVALTVFLRLHRVSFEDMQDDENVSWDAARGIMSTWLPRESSGIFYTRSSLYHYLLALWLYVLGDTKANARMFSIIPGILSVVLTYSLTLRICPRRRVAALFAACAIALSPWEIRNSQDIRFYQQVQAFSLLSMELFLLGFVSRQGRLYQNLFFIVTSVGCLSQEVFVLSFPGYCIAGLFFYRPWRWRENINVCIGFVAVLTLVIYDIGIFEVMTLTANNGVSSSNAPAMMLHIWNPTYMPATFFLGYLRGQFIYSVGFFIGLAYWLYRRNPRIATLYIQIICGVITATILVIQIEARYVYIFYPFLIVIGVLTFDGLLREAAILASRFARTWANPLRRQWLRGSTVFCALIFLVALEPAKIWRSYHYPINTEQESAFWFVVHHRLPGDVIVSNTPDVAATVTRGLDYFLENAVFFDALYQRGNNIVDRWAGGTVITNADMLRTVLLTHKRAWLIISDRAAGSYTPDMTNLIESAEVKYEWFGGRVLLWERDKGTLVWAADNGGAMDSY